MLRIDKLILLLLTYFLKVIIKKCLIFIFRTCIEYCMTVHHQVIVYNFLVWSFFMEALFQMDSSFHESFKEINPDKYYDPKFEFKFDSMKWKYCIDVMQKSPTIQPGLSYLMIEYMQPKSYIEEVTNYVENIKEVMDHTFEKAGWLSGHVKEVLRDKLHRITPLIGFSSESEDVSRLKEHFTKVRISDNFVENWIRNSDNIFSSEFFNDMLLMQVNMSMKDPMSIEARNDGNRFEIPLGIFVPPTYTPDVPKYLNYGAMGFIIAHEISHTFDFLDPSFLNINTSKEGVNEALHTFELKNQCYIDQYSKLLVDDEHMVNGRMTYQDNNADNSGIIHAFLAYRNYLEKNGEEEALPALQYTNLQMFFIRFAQLFCEILESPLESYEDNGHSPGKYRALIPLMNFPLFSQQFQCPSGSRMNPENKCLKWS